MLSVFNSIGPEHLPCLLFACCQLSLEASSLAEHNTHAWHHTSIATPSQDDVHTHSKKHCHKIYINWEELRIHVHDCMTHYCPVLLTCLFSSADDCEFTQAQIWQLQGDTACISHWFCDLCLSTSCFPLVYGQLQLEIDERCTAIEYYDSHNNNDEDKKRQVNT